MTHQLLGLFVFLYFQPVSTLSIVPPDSQNAEWRYGYKPEPSCNNLFPDETSLTEGYFCIDNYVRDANDQCIYVFDCPEFKIETTTRPSCPIGESYRTGLYPEPSCNDLYPEAKGIKEGCYCDDHLVRNPEGRCVSVYECLQFISTTTTTAATPICPAGEYYTAGLYPEPTCENIFPEDVFIKEGCFCPEDFVRDSTGKCVNYLTCPQIVTTTTTQATTTCPTGEELRVDLYPEPSCDTLFPEYGNLKEACFCLNDNVRNSAGKCVSIPECPQFTTPASSSLVPTSVPSYDDDVYSPVCPAGEYYTARLYPEPSCDNFYPENVYVKEGCFCLDNYIRNSEGKCIEIGQCDRFTEPQPNETSNVIIYGCFKCVPGESFNIDCNVCTCAQDGKSTICTTNDCGSTATDNNLHNTLCVSLPVTTPTPDPNPDNNLRLGPRCSKGKIFQGKYPKATCDKFPPDYSKIKKGRFCDPGLVRNSAGKCVSKYDRNAIISTTAHTPNYNLRSGRPRCPAGEIFRKGHEITCDESIRDFHTIKRGCLCAPGLVRNSAGKCVSMNDCNATPIGSTCVPGTRVHKRCEVCTCQPDGKTQKCLPTPCAPPQDIEK